MQLPTNEDTIWELDNTILALYRFFDRISNRIVKPSIKYYIEHIYVKGEHKSKSIVLNRILSHSFVRDLNIKLRFYSLYCGLHSYDMSDYLFSTMMYDNNYKGPHFCKIDIRKSNIKNVKIKTYAEFNCEYTTHSNDNTPPQKNKLVKSNGGSLYYGIHFSKNRIHEHIFTSKNMKSTTKYIKKYKEIKLFDMKWWDSSSYSNMFINGEEVS